MLLKLLKKNFNQLKSFLSTPPPDKHTLALLYILGKNPDIRKVTFTKRLNERGKLVSDSVRVNLIKGFDIDVAWRNEKDLNIDSTTQAEKLSTGAWQLVADQLSDKLEQEITWSCVVDNEQKTKIIGQLPGTNNYFVLSYV